MTAGKANHLRSSFFSLSAVCGISLLAVAAIATVHAAPQPPKPEANASREAFLQIYKVFTSPRCQNCHPAGDAPLQGDDSHIHLQNVKRGKDGHGVYGMRCDACHQSANLAGANMPPGNPKWSLPAPEHKMVFVGRTPAALCRQLKDPKQTGGRSLAQLLEHVSADDLVGWGWDPGTGRALPPLSRADTVAQMKIWIAGGAACPQ
jgi:mono/diheme cytochrome c family protein